MTNLINPANPLSPISPLNPVNPFNPASPLHDDLFSGKDGTTIAVTPKDSAGSVNTSTDFGPDNDLGFGIVIGLLIGIILGKMFP